MGQRYFKPLFDGNEKNAQSWHLLVLLKTFATDLMFETLAVCRENCGRDASKPKSGFSHLENVVNMLPTCTDENTQLLLQ